MPADIEALLAAVGWSQSEAGRRLGVSRNTVARWAQRKNAPGAVVLLLSFLARHKELLQEFS